MLINVKKKKKLFFIGQTDRHTDNSKLQFGTSQNKN